ncbi:hypothetical protein JCM11641_008249 [Rhodosporidiobolus odoratus]
MDSQSLIFSDPPEIPLDPRFANTNPYPTWADPKPANPAPLVRSTLSSARVIFQDAMARGKEIRWKQFQEREKALADFEKNELARMKAESVAGSRTSAPVVAGEEGDLEVLVRQQEEAEARARLLQRIIAAKQASRPTSTPLPTQQNPVPVVSANLPIEPSSPEEYPLLVQPSSSPPATPAPARLTDISLKKVSAPKAWQGDFNYRRREMFVKSATGYLASVGVGLDKEISLSVTPQAHLALRSLFSSESKGSFLSAVDWFDAIDRDHLIITPQMIFAELRAHWVDDAAAEDNFRRYCLAKQGSLKVREFGALVEQLAYDCFDRVVSDEDKASTFREGLVSGAKHFLLQVQAAQSAAFGTPARMGFKKTVQVASAYDSLESRRSTSSSPSSTSQPRSSRSANNPSSSLSSTSPSPSTSSSTPSSTQATRKPWVEAAQDWQASHPAKDKERWFRKDTRPTLSLVKCYNCCKDGHHVSSGCPNSRGDPRTIVLAAVRPKLSSTPSSPLPASETVSRFELLANEEGEEDDPAPLEEGKAGSVDRPPLASPASNLLPSSISPSSELPPLPSDSSSFPSISVSSLSTTPAPTSGSSVEASATEILSSSSEQLDTGSLQNWTKKARKKRTPAKPSLPPEPEVVSKPLTLTASIGEQDAISLVDSGSQADVLSSAFAHRLGLPFRRLLAPVHADLGADGHAVRLSIYAEVTVKVGELVTPQRSFFVAPLPPRIDAILGVPWLNDTNTAISSTSLFVVPTGPSKEVYNFRLRRFNIQPRTNFDDLGFVNRPMSSNEEHRFAVCAMMAGVEGIDDYVDFEPHNPLLDINNDDPSLPDLSAEEAEQMISALKDRFADVLVDTLPNRLPPHCPIDHDIDLLDKELKIRPKVIGIPARYDKQWRAHVLKFKETGYWSPLALESACSMFSVPKHDPSEARFVINLKPRNANTRKRISPIPDMKGVRSRLGAHRYRTKLDFKNVYEQIRLALESVAKSGFVTPSGTFVSRVMQQGDTNAPDTMHRVCAMMFEKAMGRFLDVFSDDVFIYSHTRRAHLRYLEIVLTSLRHFRFFLSRSKVDLMAPSLKALGCIIDDTGVSVDPSQWDSVQNWPVPRNKKDVMRFSGTVQWMSDHLPHLNELMAPISRLTGPVDWNWSPACQAAFELVKSLVPRTLSPLNLAALESGEEKLFIFSDASILGCGSWIGQGVTRETARPYRYHSAKFNAAQRNYHTTDQELLGVLDACLKYRELLLGWDVVVVTDHQPLRTYWDQTPKLTRRHVRLWETLSQFSLLWDFIPGKLNVLADSLSRLAELCADEEWLTLPVAQEPPPSPEDDAPFPDEPSAKMVLAVLALQAGTGRCSDVASPSSPVPCPGERSPCSLPLLAPLNASDVREVDPLTIFPSEFVSSLSSALADDPAKVMAAPSQFPLFVVNDNLLFRNDGDTPQLYVPHGVVGAEEGAPSFVELVVKHAHDGLAHFATASYMATRYYDVVFRRFGLQDSLVSDRDPKFTSDFWRSLHDRLGVDLRLSSSAHPQTDGRSEVTNKIVGQILRSLCEDDQEGWASKVALAEFAINNTPSSSTSLPLFAVLYGFLPSTWPAAPWSSPNVDVDRRGEQSRLDWLRCSDALIASRVEMVHYANRRRRDDSPQFRVGNKVFVSSAGLRFPHSLSGNSFPNISALTTSSAPILRNLPSTSLFPLTSPFILASIRPDFAPSSLTTTHVSRLAPSPLHLPLSSLLMVQRSSWSKTGADEWRPEAELLETAPDMVKSYLDLVAARRGVKPRGRRAVLASFLSRALPTVAPRRGGECKDWLSSHFSLSASKSHFASFPQ